MPSKASYLFLETTNPSIPSMNMLLWSSFLSLCSFLISPLVKLFIHLSFNIPEHETELRKTISDMKKELSKISMQDQFALYAKTEREISKVNYNYLSFTPLKHSLSCQPRCPPLPPPGP